MLCNINLFAIEVARFMALFPHYPEHVVLWAKAQRSVEVCTSSPRPKGRGNRSWQ